MRRRATALALALSLAVAGCGGQQSSGGSDGQSGASQSGGSQSGGAAGSGPTTATSGAHNAADTMFAQMMIVHHEGAIQMSKLTATRAQDENVKELATSIEQAQGPEIQKMEGWLKAWGEPRESGMHGAGHGADDSMKMNGMTQQQVNAKLSGLKGAEFDKQFLTLMIAHHQGAVTMSQQQLKQGENSDAKALAQTIIDSQQSEIDQMQTMLDSLGQH